MKRSKSLFRKVLRNIGGAVLSLLLLAIIAIAVFLALLPKDVEAYDDSHLMRPKESIPADQNAFTFYKKAVDMLRPHVGDDEVVRMYEMANGSIEWDESFATAVLGQHAEAMSLIEKGNACARCIMSRITDHEHMAVCLMPWSHLVDFFEFRIKSNCRAGDSVKAVDDLAVLLGFSHRVNEDAADSIYYLASVWHFEQALALGRTMIYEGDLDQKQLKRFMDMLDQNAPTKQGFILSCQTAYEVNVHYAEGLLSGDPEFWEWMGEERPNWASRLGAKVMFSPNAFKKAFGDLFTEQIKQVDLPYGEVEFPKKDEMREGAATTWSLSYKVVSGMALGMADLTPFLASYQLETEFQATRIIAALHLYKMKSGAFPEHLEALVPDFLSFMPIDPFDGGAMRYDAEKGVIYSVGEDLKDSGGSAAMRFGTNDARRKNAEDYVFGVDQESF